MKLMKKLMTFSVYIMLYLATICAAYAGTEIERKFLVATSEWKDGAVGVFYLQGFLSTDKDRVVRIRLVGDKGELTVKGRKTGKFTKLEFNYAISREDALVLLSLCKQPLIEKTRYKVVVAGAEWVIDDFTAGSANQGLVVAEIELESEDQRVILPDWIGKEVTGDIRYSNFSLITNPYSTW